MNTKIFQEAMEIQEELTKWRHELHKIPEIGLVLPKTSAFVQKKLAEFQIPFETKVEGNCVVGCLGKGEQCLMLRADMDGLPMQEETGLPYASENGNMHACGHDLHTAALLGAAKLLKVHERELKGCIKLLFQPAEETFLGAEAAIHDGVLENPKVDAAVGLHVASEFPAGVVAYGTQEYASVYGFKIILTGKGTHGAMPQNGIDPINAGVHIYLALQELMARECDPAEEAALTIGQFTAGNAANVIPEQAVLQGTLRTFDEKTHVQMIRRIEEVVSGVAATYRVRAEIEVLSDVPVLNCEKSQNEHFAKAFKEMSPELKIFPDVHTMGSEDFAFYAQKVPSSYFMVGAKQEETAISYAHHNPKVCFSDKALPIAASIYACAALNWQIE